MGIETLLCFLGIVLFVGMLIAGYLTVSAVEAPPEPVRVTLERFELLDRQCDEIVVRQIEHHLRRERLVANLFVDAPSVETLRSGIVA